MPNTLSRSCVCTCSPGQKASLVSTDTATTRVQREKQTGQGPREEKGEEKKEKEWMMR
jgi:hypothetical protein